VRSALGEPGRPFPVRWIIGLSLIFGGGICAGIVASLPAPYVIETPGPTWDVLGDTTVGDETVQLISIPGAETYATDGELRMLTVYATGPQHLPSWFDVVQAYFDPRRAILPVDAVYQPDTTEEELAERAKVDMRNSQHAAIAAALDALGYDLDVELSVAGIDEGGPSDGILQEGDIILAIDGISEFDDVDAMIDAIVAHGTDTPAELLIERDGRQRTVEITPTMGESGRPIIGIFVATEFEFPIDVDIQLENVGGPSAGVMFALGIYDKLTPGSLTGGEIIAGTGTINAAGEVGAIGGIQQKMWGALDAGAAWFLAPTANCRSVVGHIPGGLEVVAVSTLDEAIDALEVIATGGDTESLPSCS